MEKKLTALFFITATLFSSGFSFAQSGYSPYDNTAICKHHMKLLKNLAPADFSSPSYHDFFRTASSGYGFWKINCTNGNCTLSLMRPTGFCGLLEYYQKEGIPVGDDFFPYLKNIFIPLMQKEEAAFNQGKDSLPYDGKFGGVNISCPYREGSIVDPKQCDFIYATCNLGSTAAWCFAGSE